MSVINQALKDLQKRQQQGTARARSVYQSPQRRGYVLGLGIGAGVLGGMLISYLMITHAMAGPALEVAHGEPSAQQRGAQQYSVQPSAQQSNAQQPSAQQRGGEPSTEPSTQLSGQYGTANENAPVLQQEAVTVSSDSAVYNRTEPTRTPVSERAADDETVAVTRPERVTGTTGTMASPVLERAAYNETGAVTSPARVTETVETPASTVEHGPRTAKPTVEHAPKAAEPTIAAQASQPRADHRAGHVVRDTERSEEPQGSMRVERVERSADELAEQRLEQAIGAIDGGRGRHGESLLQEALILRPDYTEARQRLAGYYYGRGFSSEALRVLQEGLALSPDNSALLGLIARIYEETNRPAEALRMLNRLNVQLPEHSDLLVLRAAMANELGHYTSAAEDYRALLHINPHQGIWWLGLGYAEEQQGDPTAAELAYKQALADERLDRESRDYVRSRMEVLNAW